MTTQPAASPPLTTADDDYAYEMHVDVPRARIIAAVTDAELIPAWWTAATRSERHGDTVQLFVSGGALLVDITIDHAPGSGDVSWTVNGCIMDDWIGTRPTFSVRDGDDGTAVVEFRHVGLRPSLACFDQCRAGWNHFMPSLHQYLETGVGRPNEPRDPSA